MRKIRILSIFPDIYTPGIAKEMEDRAQLGEHLLRETNCLVNFESRTVDKGNVSVENSYDMAMVAPYILRMAKQAQNENYDALIMDGFLDPCLDECREYLTIPVFGAGLSSCSLAARLGGEFSIVSILDDMVRISVNNMKKYGLYSLLVSVPVVHVTVLELHDDADVVVKKIADASENAIRYDKAKSIVFGCTGMSPHALPVRQELLRRGIDVPVIEPMRAALYDAIGCVLHGVSHSKTAYPPIRSKHRVLDWIL